MLDLGTKSSVQALGVSNSGWTQSLDRMPGLPNSCQVQSLVPTLGLSNPVWIKSYARIVGLFWVCQTLTGPVSSPNSRSDEPMLDPVHGSNSRTAIPRLGTVQGRTTSLPNPCTTSNKKNPQVYNTLAKDKSLKFARKERAVTILK